MTEFFTRRLVLRQSEMYSEGRCKRVHNVPGVRVQYVIWPYQLNACWDRHSTLCQYHCVISLLLLLSGTNISLIDREELYLSLMFV